MKLSTVFISHLNDLIMEIDGLEGDTQLKLIMEMRMRILRELASDLVTGTVDDEQLEAYTSIAEEKVSELYGNVAFI